MYPDEETVSYPLPENNVMKRTLRRISLPSLWPSKQICCLVIDLEVEFGDLWIVGVCRAWMLGHAVWVLFPGILRPLTGCTWISYACPRGLAHWRKLNDSSTWFAKNLARGCHSLSFTSRSYAWSNATDHTMMTWRVAFSQAPQEPLQNALNIVDFFTLALTLLWTVFDMDCIQMLIRQYKIDLE